MSKAAPPQLTNDIMERLVLARAGDEDALEDIIRHYQDRIAAYVGFHVGNRSADFDDLCQVVFVKMALSLTKLRSLDVFEPWLFTIARNVCRDHVRRLRLRDLFVPLSPEHEGIAADLAIETSSSGQCVLDG